MRIVMVIVGSSGGRSRRRAVQRLKFDLVLLKKMFVMLKAV